MTKILAIYSGPLPKEGKSPFLSNSSVFVVFVDLMRFFPLFGGHLRDLPSLSNNSYSPFFGDDLVPFFSLLTDLMFAPHSEAFLRQKCFLSLPDLLLSFLSFSLPAILLLSKPPPPGRPNLQRS